MSRLIAPTLLLALTACGPDEVRVVGEYDSIENRSDATTRVATDADGDRETIEISCLTGSASDIRIETENGFFDGEASMTVRSDGDVSDCTIILDPDTLERIHVSGNGDIDIEGTATGLGLVSITGSGNLDINAVHTDNFQLDASGTGDLSIGDLVLDELDVNMTGTSSATLAGEVESADVYLTGTTALDARDLVVQDLDLEMNGDAEAEITVEGSLDADLSGSATLDVWAGADLELGDIIEDGSANYTIR